MQTNLFVLASILVFSLFSKAKKAPDFFTNTHQIVLLSDFQSKLGCKIDFDASCNRTAFTFNNKTWSLKVNVPAGTWKIKVYHDGNSYGQHGKLDGTFISLTTLHSGEIEFQYEEFTHELHIIHQTLESRSQPPAINTLTLDDTLIYDMNSNMIANPGDSIRYTMILKNQSGQSMLNAIITHNGDPNVKFDSSSVIASPLAFNDTINYDVHPKTLIAPGILANDFDLNDVLPNPPNYTNLSVIRVNSLASNVGVSFVTTGGGTVTVNANGSITYDSTGVNGALTDIIYYTILDQDGFEDSASILIQFNAPPVISSNLAITDTICAFEQRDTFIMTPAFTISDDELNEESAKIQICTNYLSTEDTLIAGSLPGGISALWIDGTGTLMLMGSASLADYETAIENIQYTNQSNHPNTSIREICVTVNDGILNSNQVIRLLKVKPVNDCPTAVRDSISILENGPIPVYSVLTNDIDPDLDVLSVSKINGGATLTGVVVHGGTVSLNGTTGNISFAHTTGFSGLDSLSAGELFFARFAYSATDGICEDADSVIIKITGVNDAPLISSNLLATDSICAFEQQDTFIVTSAFTLADDEDNEDSASIQICANYLASEDTLIAGILPGGIIATWNDATGTLTLKGNTTKANYETAIENIQYTNQSNTPNTNPRRICITVNDGDLNSNQVTRELKIKPVNDCPVAVLDSISIMENANIAAFNVLANDLDVEMNTLTVTKINTIASLTNIAINGGLVSIVGGNGNLSFTQTTGFSGLDSLSAGEMFIARLSYTISDGICEDADSVIIKITGVNDAPLISSNLLATDSICAFEQQDTFIVTSAFTLADDEDNEDSASIQICTNYLASEDTLIAGILPGGIIATWNDATGTLTLKGNTTKANYETAIENIQYTNQSNTPNTNPRRICITVNDGDLNSNQVTRALKIKPVNDCPVAVRDTFFVNENAAFAVSNVLTNDTDPEMDVLTATPITNVAITGGTVNLLSNGSFTFAHTTGPTGLDTLNVGQMFFARTLYTISDGACTDNDSVIIKITGVNDAPVADSNSYSVVQTTILSVSAPGILADDKDIDHLSTIVVGTVQGSAGNVGSLITLPSGAELTVNANGSFIYNPKCLVGGIDTFSYQVKDEQGAFSNTVLVYINVSQVMWFVSASAGMSGTGSFSNPFDQLSDAQTVSLAGQYIFVFPGTYNESITLKNNQKLIGANEDWLCPGGSTIRSASMTSTINGTVTLAQNDTIKGIEFGNNAANTMIQDNGATAGNLFISNTNLNTTTSSGLRIANGGVLNVTIDAFNSSSNATALFIKNCSGNLTVSGGTIIPTMGVADTMAIILGGTLSATISASISQPSNFPLSYIGAAHTGTITFQTGTLSATNGSGLQFDNADGTYNFNGTTTLNATTNNGKAAIDILNGSAGTFSFSSNTTITSPTDTAFDLRSSTASVTYSGNITQANNQAMVFISAHTTGTITFQTGTLSATNGSGLQFDNADGTYNFFGTATLNGGDAGIDIINGSGGNFAFSNAPITNPSGVAFLVNGGGGSIGHSGAISKTSAGKLIDIQSRTGSSVTFNSNLSSTFSSTGINVSSCTGGTVTFAGGTKTINTGSSTAITLATNTGTTIDFTGGGLDIDVTSGTGFNATGGATAINVTGTGNTINSTTGTALNVANTTIGASNLNFQSISTTMSSSSNGINIDNTGSSGGLIVTGTGTAASGGTIANKTGSDGSFSTGIGIYLNNTRNVSLTRMQLNDFQNFAIYGNSVTNLTMSNCVINGANGTLSGGAGEGSIYLLNLFGTNSVTSCTVSGGNVENFTVVNSSGILTSLTVSNCAIQNNNTTNGNMGFSALSTVSATMNVTVNNCTFMGNRTIAIRGDAADASTLNITVTNNVITAGTGGNNQGNQGIEISRALTSSVTYNVTGNTVTGMISTLINIFSGGGNAGATVGMSGVVVSNVCTGTGTGGNQFGIRVFNSGSLATGAGFIYAKVANNMVSQIDNAYGILVEASGSTGPPAHTEASVINNNVSVVGTALDCIRLQARNTATLCAKVSGNTTNSGGSGFYGIQVRQANTATFSLEGLTIGPQTEPTVHNYLLSQNPSAATISSDGSVTMTITGVAAGACSNIPF